MANTNQFSFLSHSYLYLNTTNSSSFKLSSPQISLSTQLQNTHTHTHTQMAHLNNFKQLFFFLVSLGSTKSQLPPSVSPTPAPAPGAASVLSPPSPLPTSTISFPPSSAPSIAPTAEAPAESDGPIDFSTALPPSKDVNPDVKNVCSSTDHPDLCLATVVPYLKGKSDPPSVLEEAIRAGFKFAKYGLSQAKVFAEKPDASPKVKDCKDSYDSAVSNYENTISAFPKRDIGTMNSMLSAVITEIGDCEDGFAGAGDKSPFSDIAPRLKNMTSNCLAIISLLD